jgi:CHAT domain-containing protein/Flp pilus assembly protein TadD
MTLFSWFNKSALALDKAPFYPLAEQVCQDRLSLEEARRQATAPRVLARVNVDLVDRYDDAIRALALHDLCMARALAELNYAISQCLGDESVQGSCAGTLGWVYRERNQLDEALAHYQQSCRIFEALPEGRFIVAETRRDIGDIYERQEKLEAARDEYEAMRQIAVALRRPDLQSEALNRQGRLYLIEGKIMDTLAAFDKALKLSRQHGLGRGLETALGNRGVAYQLLGRLADAERDHREALAISQSIDAQNVRDAVPITQRFVDLDHIGRHMGDLGSVLLARGQLDEAEQQLVQAIEIARQTNDRAGQQQRQGTLGNVYQAKPQHQPGQPDRHGRWLAQAIEHHTQAIELARERGDQRSQCVHLLGLGNDYYGLEHFDEAQRCYDEAFDLARIHQIADALWRLEYVRGNLAVARGQYAAAYEHYASAVKQAETQRSRISIELRMNFWHDRVALYKHAALCCLHLERSDGLRLALQYTEQSKARYLADQLGQTTSAEDDIQAVLGCLDQDTAVVVFNVAEKETLVFILTNPPGPSDVELDQGWQTAERARIRARRFDSFDRRTLLRLLVETDDAGEAIGGYLVDYYRERGALNQAREEGRELAFEERCWANGTLEEKTKFVYTAILAAVDQALASLAIKRVIFMPNLGLALLPLQACCRSNGSAPDYFVDHYTVQYTPSFRMLRHCQQLAGLAGDRADLLAVANPTHDRYLEGAEIEIKLIEQLFQAADKHLIFSEETASQATPRAVLDAAPGYTFIHFACHGYFNLIDLLRSALTLAAEPASADQGALFELLTLDMLLRSPKLPHTRLVVMSACETGMADPGNLADEYFSLPAGFLLAGAPTVVASLWIADGLSTILLMRYFYQQIIQDCSPAAALRCAQTWLRNLSLAAWQDYNDEFWSSVPFAYFWLERERQQLLEQYGDDEAARPFAHPYHWAAFTVIGV